MAFNNVILNFDNLVGYRSDTVVTMNIESLIYKATKSFCGRSVV